MHEEGHEDVETELWVGVVSRIRDEPLGQLVQGNGYGCLQPNGEERIRRDMVVVLLLSFHVAGVAGGARGVAMAVSFAPTILVTVCMSVTVLFAIFVNAFYGWSQGSIPGSGAAGSKHWTNGRVGIDLRIKVGRNLWWVDGSRGCP